MSQAAYIKFIGRLYYKIYLMTPPCDVVVLSKNCYHYRQTKDANNYRIIWCVCALFDQRTFISNQKEIEREHRSQNQQTIHIQRLIMDSHATTVVNCMLLALKTYPFKIYINDSNGVSAFNPIAELNLTSGPTIVTAEYSVPGNVPTSASARWVLQTLSFIFIFFYSFHICFDLI